MSAVLILPEGSVEPVEVEVEEETLLREAGADGQVVNLNITDDLGHSFTAWMAIDPAQPINSKARSVIANLSALHMMCFGPILITQIDDDLVTEIVGG